MSEQEAHDLIRKQVTSNDIVLFVKGTKQSPQCGFSGQVAQILGHLGVDYKDINVLDDPRVREGIKSYTNWPTIPQLYVRRVRRWLRYRPRDVSIGRAAGADKPKGCADGTAAWPGPKSYPWAGVLPPD
jgi:Grx4 family monothiol glutaredoxin